jgi:hypothetical protein
MKYLKISLFLIFLLVGNSCHRNKYLVALYIYGTHLFSKEGKFGNGCFFN